MADDVGKIEGEPAPGSAGPLDIAMAAEARDPAPDSPARQVLVRHARLLDQQLRHGRMALVRDRIKLLRDLSLAGVVVVLLGAAGWTVWDASRADGVVIEPLSTPPTLAQAGLTGPAAAARLLDQLDAMQTTVEGVSAVTRRAASGGADAIKVVIPSTGVSAGEVLRLLRRRLGEETIVTGEMAEAGPGRLSLTVRVDGRGARSFTAPAAEVDALFAQAAEAVYERTEPYKHTIWLFSRGRGAENHARLRALTYGGSREDRAWAWTGIAALMRVEGRFAEAAAAARRSAALNPDLPNAWGHIFEAEALMGRTEPFLAAMDGWRPWTWKPRCARGPTPHGRPALR